MIPIEAEIEEIEELDEGINKMARKISALLENVRQEKEMQHLTELQLIQAQVNPHFLYNTLDTIVWLIEGGMTDDAVEMISSLSIFLPYFTFQRKRYHPALGRRTSYIELSGDPAVPLPGYPGI